MLKPVPTQIEYQIPLSVLEFDILTFLNDNDLIDLYTDNTTEVQVTEMNGHFGTNIFVKCGNENKKGLNMFVRWLKKIIEDNQLVYMEGFEDAQNLKADRYIFQEDAVVLAWEADEILIEEYYNSAHKFSLYRIGRSRGNYSLDELNGYSLT